MTKEKHQKAFKEAEKELLKDKVSEIKDIMKSILQSIWDEKRRKTEAEENLRLLKLDMEDLKVGKIERIKERHAKSKKASNISPIKEIEMDKLEAYSSTSCSTSPSTSSGNWADTTGGTYFINAGGGEIKEINL